MITVKCKKCNKEFKTHSAKIKIGRGKFCSKECYHPKIDYGTKNCIVCDKSFSKGKNISQKAWGKAKCCSFFCASKYKKTQIPWMKDKHHTDITKQKIREKHKGKHYSIKSEFRKGIKVWNDGSKGIMKPNKTSFKKGMIPYNYKGGIETENMKIRHSVEIKLWRKSCLQRDNFTDQKYGGSEDLCVHHINNFADFKELRTSIENGVTLSRKAHEDFHKKYGTKNNTREQLLEFLNN